MDFVAYFKESTSNHWGLLILLPVHQLLAQGSSGRTTHNTDIVNYGLGWKSAHHPPVLQLLPNQFSSFTEF